MDQRETICINALLEHLGRCSGTKWEIDVPDLDRRYPDRPTPECTITDGQEIAAVEVKALKGPQDQSDFFGDLRYLGRVLAPTTPGHFVVGPPYDNSPRWEKSFIRRVKREVERVAPTLHPGGDKGYVRIPRRARVAMANEKGSLVSCYHGHSEPLRQLAASTKGTFMIIDEEACSALESEQGKLSYAKAVAKACAEAKRGQSDAWVEWFDEWPIWRLDAGESHVEVIAVWGAFSVTAAIEETIWKAIEDGRRKFTERWALQHILLLDSQFAFTDVERVQGVLETLRPAAYGGVDEVLLYWDKRIWPLYAAPTAPLTPSPPASA